MVRASDIKLTPENIAQMSQRQSLALGWYQFLVTEANAKVAKSGSLMIELRCAPLAETDDPNSKVAKLSLRNNIVLPVANPEVADHTPPNTIGIVVSALKALGVEGIEDYPRQIDGQLTFKGEAIEKAEEDEARQEVTELAVTKVLELYDNPSELVDCAFYGQVIEKDGFTNIAGMRSELPDGESLVPADEFVKKAVVAVKVKSNGKAPVAAKTKKK